MKIEVKRRVRSKRGARDRASLKGGGGGSNPPSIPILVYIGVFPEHWRHSVIFTIFKIYLDTCTSYHDYNSKTKDLCFLDKGRVFLSLIWPHIAVILISLVTMGVNQVHIRRLQIESPTEKIPAYIRMDDSKLPTHNTDSILFYLLYHWVSRFLYVLQAQICI